METLPIIAGLVTGISALILMLSLIVFHRTRIKRMLSITAIGLVMLIKGILLFLKSSQTLSVDYEMFAFLDVVVVIILLMMFGKE